MQLFISYARVDRQSVDHLYETLEKAGHIVWIDKEISGGDHWWQVILEAIEACDVFVFALSPQSSASIYCQAELRYAMTLNKPILPVMIDRASLPFEELRRTHYINATTGLDDSNVILQLTRNLFRLHERIDAGEFPRPNPMPARPDVPSGGNRRSSIGAFCCCLRRLPNR